MMSWQDEKSHFGKYSVREAKLAMQAAGIEVRL